jgi:hypothetical protein
LTVEGAAEFTKRVLVQAWRMAALTRHQFRHWRGVAPYGSTARRSPQ